MTPIIHIVSTDIKELAEDEDKRLAEQEAVMEYGIEMSEVEQEEAAIV
jgi:ACT domain-containing protein